MLRKWSCSDRWERNVVTIAQLPGNIPAFDHKGLIHEKKTKCFLSTTKTALGHPYIFFGPIPLVFSIPVIVRFFVVYVFFDYFVRHAKCVLTITTSIMQSLCRVKLLVVQCVKYISYSCPQREVFLEKLKKEKFIIVQFLKWKSYCTLRVQYC